MSKPKIPQKVPYGVEVKPGEYWWCACGESQNQPFCDGSHKGTGFQPVVVNVEEKKTIWFCGCKHTKNQPFCDGNHKNIED